MKSTWDENLYTTKLDPTKMGISRDEADRLAREIEGSIAANRHLAEERNQSRDTGEEVSDPAPSHLRHICQHRRTSMLLTPMCY